MDVRSDQNKADRFTCATKVAEFIKKKRKEPNYDE